MEQTTIDRDTQGRYSDDRGTTLLIVDKHPVLCEWLSTRLAEVPGFEVVAMATSASSLADLVEAYHPSVVVLDGGILRTAGPQLVRRVRGREAAPAVVLLVAEDNPDDAAHALRAGASAFVLKEAPLQDLVAAIRWAQRGDVWISTALLAQMLEGRRRVEGPEDTGWSALTEREREVLALLVEGFSQKQIACHLKIAVNTVRAHTRNVQMKLHVHSNLAAVWLAMSHGMRPHRLEN